MKRSLKKPIPRITLSLGLALLICGVDQYIKNLIVANFHTFEVKPFIGEFIRLTYVLNDSAAFSLGFGLTGIFTIISSAAVIALIWFIVKKTHDFSWALMAGVLLGGVAGNLIDRFVRHPGAGLGRVVDYILIPFNFPVFNLADIAIVVIASLTAIRVLLGHKVGNSDAVAND